MLGRGELSGKYLFNISIFQVVCSSILAVFKAIKPDNKKHIFTDLTKDDFNFDKNIINVADLNDDSKVDFDEFVGKIVNYTMTLFDVLDNDKDGFLSKDAFKLQPLSMNVFTTTLHEVFLFFDSNKDKMISVEDYSTFLTHDCKTSPICDTNDDGHFSLREILDMYLINLPAPLYNLYRQIDINKNEKLGYDEAMEIMKKTFGAIDADADCQVDLEEVDALLEEIQLPADFRLSLRLLGQQYLSLGQYLIQVSVPSSNPAFVPVPGPPSVPGDPRHS